jgi:hypothetical protein
MDLFLIDLIDRRPGRSAKKKMLVEKERQTGFTGY